MLAEAARRNHDFRFIGMNTQDRPESAAEFLAQTGMTYPQLVDVDGLVLADTRVPGLPVTLALDAEREGRRTGGRLGLRRRADNALGRTGKAGMTRAATPGCARPTPSPTPTRVNPASSSRPEPFGRPLPSAVKP